MSYRIELSSVAQAPADTTQPGNQERDTLAGVALMIAAAVAGNWIYRRYFVKPHRRKLHEPIARTLRRPGKNTLR